MVSRSKTGILIAGRSNISDLASPRMSENKGLSALKSAPQVIQTNTEELLVTSFKICIWCCVMFAKTGLSSSMVAMTMDPGATLMANSSPIEICGTSNPSASESLAAIWQFNPCALSATTYGRNHCERLSLIKHNNDLQHLPLPGWPYEIEKRQLFWVELVR